MYSELGRGSRAPGKRGKGVHTHSSSVTLVLLSTHTATHRNHREGSVNRSGKTTG